MNFQVLPSLVLCSDLVFSFLIACFSTSACSIIRTILKSENYSASLIHSLGIVIQRLLKFELLFFYYQILEISGNLMWTKKNKVFALSKFEINFIIRFCEVKDYYIPRTEKQANPIKKAIGGKKLAPDGIKSGNVINHPL